MAKKKTNQPEKKNRQRSLEELRKKGIELNDEDQISGGFPDYPIPPKIDDPEEDDKE